MIHRFTYPLNRLIVIILPFLTVQLHGQDTLDSAYRAIAADLTGTLGAAALHIETGESYSFRGSDRFPMQSVYKFPIAMVML